MYDNSANIVVHVGLDDTDSLEGSCTTYIAALIIESISSYVTFLDYPRLIRNNPNIPWKTRGNGAVALSFFVPSTHFEDTLEKILFVVENNYKGGENTNPGVVIVKGNKIKEFSFFTSLGLTTFVSIKTIKLLLLKNKINYHQIGNGRGLIGAMSAIANQLKPGDEDFTYELLTYRIPSSITKPRQLDLEKIKEMDTKLSPLVYNNIDDEDGRVLIAPTGNDPVLYGIRGESPEVLLNAFQMVHSFEPIERYCIFRTNQCTEQHFKYASSDIKNFNVFQGEIKVLTKPKTLLGGHVFFEGEVQSSKKVINIAAFEPTKGFRKGILSLYPDDVIRGYGGIRYKKPFGRFTLNLEKCEIIKLSEVYKEESPFCPHCVKRMISNGFNKGHKCRKCGHKEPKSVKTKTLLPRKPIDQVLIPPASAQRHLTKPLRRYNLPPQKEVKIVSNWWKKFN